MWRRKYNTETLIIVGIAKKLNIELTDGVDISMSNIEAVYTLVTIGDEVGEVLFAFWSGVVDAVVGGDIMKV